MPAGRPTIKLTDLPSGWKEMIIELSKEGASIVELAVELGVSRDTFYALSEREDEFSDTIKICKEHCEVWWLKKGRKNLENKDFSFTGWYMNMKNRFGWRDKTEVDQKNTNVNVPLSEWVKNTEEGQKDMDDFKPDE